MILWMNGDTWGLLWSGILGAAVSGGVAAGVAMIVLRRTSAHQTKLAQEEAVRQESRAVTALQEQREGQLQEQRDEARKAREMAAIADVVAASGAMTTGFTSGVDGVNKLKSDMMTAIVRWKMELRDYGMEGAITNWDYTLGQAAQYAAWEIQGSVPKSGIEKAFLTCVPLFHAALMDWVKAEEFERPCIIDSLNEMQQTMDANIDKVAAQQRTVGV
jgi:hypothetical protein